MSSWISSTGGFWVDAVNGTLTDISSTVNNLDTSGGTQLLDDTGLSDTIENFVGGIAAGTRIPANGFLNSTTYAIFAPLQNQTSVTKTIQIKDFTAKYRYGEAWPTEVKLSQPVKAQGTWSCEFVAVNGLSRTSISQV
jgi:hypothetical protein